MISKVFTLSPSCDFCVPGGRRYACRCQTRVTARGNGVDRIPPLRVETVVEEDERKQAEIEGQVGIELLDDLPWREASLVGVGTGEIEIELVERGFGEELGPAPEGLQVEIGRAHV